MIDIKLVRTDPEGVKLALRRRNKSFDNIIDEVLAVDEERRRTSGEADALRAELNQASKSIPQLKKAGQDTTEVFARLKMLSDTIKSMETNIAEIEQRQQDILLNVPNIPHESVPEGADDKENVEIRRWGTPRVFEFEPKAHWDLGDSLSILDPQTAAKVTGARFHFLKGMGARLERAIINFYLDTHTQHGYTEIMPPLMVNRASMTATGQLPKFEEDAFKLQDTEYFLIPTSEVPVTNMVRGEILDVGVLPLKYCAYTPCFRKEAGSAGRDTRGLIRQHQFDKVEMVKISHPDDSYNQLEEMTADAERVLQLLGLPYRVVLLCGGDMGFSAAKTYDIEVWLPSYNRYCEISSCSNCEDYQARRGSMRFKESVKAKTQLVHTLNGSGVAIGRTMAAILENYQNDDGTVTIPEALVKYMGTDKIAKF